MKIEEFRSFSTEEKIKYLNKKLQEGKDISKVSNEMKCSPSQICSLMRHDGCEFKKGKYQFIYATKDRANQRLQFKRYSKY